MEIANTESAKVMMHVSSESKRILKAGKNQKTNLDKQVISSNAKNESDD